MQKISKGEDNMAIKPVSGEIKAQVLNDNFSALDSQLTNLSIGPFDTYTNLSALQSAYPNGRNGFAVVLESDGKTGYMYTWTGSAWKKGGLAQSMGIGVHQVKNKHIDITAIAQENIDTNFSNIFNKHTAIRGRYVTKASGFVSSPAWSTSDYINVQFGDVISVNEGFSAVAVGYNNDDECIWELILGGGPVGKTSFTIPVNVSKIILNVLVANIDTYVATKNRELPDVYMPHRKTKIEWLDLEDKSVAQRHLSDDVFYRESSWSGKNAQWYGDSISWQDGKVYTGTSNVARGYQTLLKEALHFGKIDNLAISGRPISDGTANGAGTVSTVISSYTSSDLVVVAGGTNDFKLNVPIGDFDSTSKNEFYGALHAIVKHVLTLTPNQIIIFLAPLQRDSVGYDVNFVNSAGHKLIDYVNAISDICDYYSLPFFDGYRKSGITKLNLGVNTLDGLHLNDTGYKKVSKNLIPFFESVRGE